MRKNYFRIALLLVIFSAYGGKSQCWQKRQYKPFQIGASHPIITPFRRKISSIRGGGANIFNHSSRGPHSPSKYKSLDSSSDSLAFSAYIIAQEVVTKHIFPAICDPYERLWVPTKEFLNAKREAGMNRRSEAYISSTTKIERLPMSKKEASQQPISLDAASTRTLAISSCRDGPVQKMLLPARFLRLSLTALILAELLDRVGILSEDSPAMLRSQFHRVWYDVEPFFYRLQGRLRIWWGRIAPVSFQSMPTRYQFALGAGFGMIASPVLASFLALTWQPTLMLYGCAELNNWFKETGKLNGMAFFCNNLIARRIDQGLEWLREKCRNLVTFPSSSSSYARETMLKTSGGSKEPYRLGVSGYKGSYPACLDTRSLQLLENAPSDRRQAFLEMLRHGFVIGGAIGFAFGA